MFIDKIKIMRLSRKLGEVNIQMSLKQLKYKHKRRELLKY